MAIPNNPIELLQRIFHAIDELRQLDAAQADGLLALINSKPIGKVTADDLQLVWTLLEKHRSTPTTTQPSCYINRDYGHFLDAIPQGQKLLGDIEGLASSDDFDTLVERAERVFIERLGYTKARLNESERTARVEFSRIERIGHFGEMDVVCVLLSRSNKYAAFYDVVFRLHPYALLISLEPEARVLRLVYRQGPSKRPQYRCLTGPHAHWEPNDNLLVWTWRLHQLRPHLGETAQNLQRRVTRALNLSPEDIGRDWPSVSIDPKKPIPGVAWEKAPRRAFESFLQLDCPPAEQRRWGLKAILRDRLPISVSRGMARIEYLGHRVGGEPPSVEECIRSGANRERKITIEVRLCWGEESHLTQIQGTLPEPDDIGRFVFEGVPYRFTAQIREDGRLSALPEELYEGLDEDEDEGKDDDDSALELVQQSQAESSESDPPEPEKFEGSRPLADFRGLSPRAFYEFAVSRKLAGMAYVLWRLPLISGSSVAEQILRRIRRFGRRLDEFPLAAWTVLRRFLARDDGSAFIRAEDWQVASSPPSWCCLDRSASLPSGLFLPIAGARMHPTGSLAIPIQTDGTIRLSLSRMPATRVNPRVEGKPFVGLADWWISADLAGLGKTRVGTPGAPELAATARPVKARVAVIQGSEPRAWLTAAIPLPYRRSHLVERRVPAEQDTCPMLLVDLGTRVAPGVPWLRVDPACWSITGEWQQAPEEKLALAILQHCDDSEAERRLLQDDPRWLERIPPGIRGVVVGVSLTPSVGLFGRERSWIARIEIQPPNDINGVVVGPDGSIYPIAGTRNPCDLPFDAEGQPVDVLVEEPCYIAEPGDSLLDGNTGEPISARLQLDGWRFAHYPQPAPVESDMYLRVRRVDGEGLPGHSCSPSLTERERLRWLILQRDAVQPLVRAAARNGRPCWTPKFRLAAESAGIHLTADLDPLPVPPKRVERDFHDPIITKLRRRLKEHEAGAALSLPIPAIHPWRKPAAAAVLGLSAPELDRLINRHGVATVVAAIRGTLENAPYEAALRRIREESNPRTRATIAEALRRLQSIPRDALEARLLLTAVPVPSPTLLPVGFPPGSSRALRTPMLHRYRTVAFATEMVKQFSNGPAGAREIAEAELQQSIEELFGPHQGALVNGHTLAGWLSRLYPPTRAFKTRTTTANLSTVLTANGPSPALVENGIVISLPIVRQHRKPAELSWWQQRAACAHLTGTRLTWFLGLFAAFDLPSNQRPRVNISSPDGPLGEWALREWLRRLEHPAARPFRLAQLLEKQIPFWLPAAPERAAESLDPVLKEAFPGTDEAGMQLRRLLTQILTGFWTTAASQEAPTGWLWCAPDENPPPRARRCVPPFRSQAWLLWPCIEAATCAPQLALDIEDGRPMPTLLRALTGFPYEATLKAPEPIDIREHIVEPTVEAASLPEIPETFPSTPSSFSSVLFQPLDSDITINTTGLRRWLEATRPHPSAL